MGTRIVLEAVGDSLAAWEEHPDGSRERVACYVGNRRRWSRFRRSRLGRKRLALAILQLYFGGLFAKIYTKPLINTLLLSPSVGDSWTEERIYEWAVTEFHRQWPESDTDGTQRPPEYLDPRSYPWREESEAKILALRSGTKCLPIAEHRGQSPPAQPDLFGRERN